MRPCHTFHLFAELQQLPEAGLSRTASIDYNHRQILPLWNRPVPGDSRDSLSTEAVMNRRRKQPGSQPAESAEAIAQQPVPETRAAKLERIRREIQAGTYETPEKLETAIGRMLGVLID
jgi:hypothetical protein